MNSNNETKRIAALKAYNHERIYMKYAFALDMDENKLPRITKLSGKVMLRSEWSEVVSLLTSNINCSKKKHLTASKQYFVRMSADPDGYVLLQRTGEQEKIVPYCSKVFGILRRGWKKSLQEKGQTIAVSQRALLAWVQASYAYINYGHVRFFFNKSVSGRLALSSS